VNTYLLEPHDPLLVRDGRPFTAGGYAQTLPFVLPTTLSGFVRTVHGSETGTFDPARIPDLMALQTVGPLLCDPQEQLKLYVPAPRDAVAFNNGKRSTLVPLTPTPLPSDIVLDLPQGELLPLTLLGNPKGKPEAGAPFWAWTSVEAWLGGSLDDATPETVRLETDERLHVSVDPVTRTAVDGALFGTRSLDFQTAGHQPLTLMFQTTATLREGAYPFGGERRLSSLTASRAAFPVCPQEIREAIVRTGLVRLMLLTPAMFTHGWRPERLLADTRVTLKAAVTGRPRTVSGWDLAHRRPKPTRRLAPEGSVYFLELGGDEAARDAWITQHWFTCVSDDAQDCRDGLGLAALGLWRTHD